VGAAIWRAYGVDMTWEQRVAEAGELATQAGRPDVDGRLVDLLLDPEDTAVSHAAAEPLLARADLTGLRLFVEAFGSAEEATRNKLGDCLYDYDGGRWAFVRQSLPPLIEDPRPAVRQGAAALNRHMTEEERGSGG
jgi:hypothetical protein